MKNTKLVLVALLSMAFAGAASAADVAVSGNLSGESAFTWRGIQMSNDEPSLGFGLRADHASGFYAAADVNTVKMTAKNQLLTGLSVGYATKVANDVTLGAGMVTNVFSGSNGVNDMSFSEVFGFAKYQGATAKLSYNVDGGHIGPFDVAALYRGNVYGEVGYTYKVGKYSLGGDVGYTWFDGKAVDQGAVNGTSVVTARAGYMVNDRLSVGIAHQLGGHAEFGEKQEANHTTSIKAVYSF